MDEFVLSPRIIHKQQNLWSPELDVFLLESQEVLAHLMVDEILRDVSPGFGGTGVVDNEEDDDQDANASCSI